MQCACLLAGTQSAYPQRDGQAELTWVAGSAPNSFTHPKTVTQPGTNWARHKRQKINVNV